MFTDRLVSSGMFTSKFVEISLLFEKLLTRAYARVHPDRHKHDDTLGKSFLNNMKTNYTILFHKYSEWELRQLKGFLNLMSDGL